MLLTQASHLWSPNAFLERFVTDLSVCKTFEPEQRLILWQRATDFSGTIRSYDDLYPLVRIWWGMTAYQFIQQIPGAEARAFNPDRVTYPWETTTLNGGEPVDKLGCFAERETVIEVRCRKDNFERATGQGYIGRFEDEILTEISPDWNTKLYRDDNTEFRFRLPTPQGATKRNQTLRQAYCYGMIPLSAYAVFLKRSEWPVGVSFTDSRDSIEFFYHDLGHLSSRSQDPVLMAVGRLLFEGGIKAFPQVDVVRVLDESPLGEAPFLSSLHEALEVWVELFKSRGVDHLASYLENLGDNIASIPEGETRRRLAQRLGEFSKKTIRGLRTIGKQFPEADLQPIRLALKGLSVRVKGIEA